MLLSAARTLELGVAEMSREPTSSWSVSIFEWSVQCEVGGCCVLPLLEDGSLIGVAEHIQAPELGSTCNGDGLKVHEKMHRF